MNGMRVARCSIPWVIIVILFCALAAWAFAHAKLGDVIEDMELPTLSGGKLHLLGNSNANVFIFFKPGQEHSNATLKQIAACEQEFNGKSVRWVAIVSDRFTRAEVEAEVKDVGIAMPVLIDVGDGLYGKLGVALTPVIGMTDKEGKLAAYEPFLKVNYGEVIRARIRRLLGEIDDEQLAQVLRPVAMVQGSDAEVARRRLRLAEREFEAKNYEKALASAKRSIEKDPALVAAHVVLGQILAAQGNQAEALKAFEAALKLDPENAAALQGQKGCQPGKD